LNASDTDRPGHEPGYGEKRGDDIQVLVLGVGNDMMGDEGIGVRVARELIEGYVFPAEVEVVDGGVGGMSLMPLIRAAGEVVIVDAVDASAKAGSIFMFNSEELEMDDAPRLSVHDTGIVEVIRTAALMNEGLSATIIGVQPKKMDEFGADLSRPVARKMGRVIEIIIDLLESRGLAPEPKAARPLANPSEKKNA